MNPLFWLLVIGSAIFGALIIVVILVIISKLFNKRKTNNFINSYNRLSLGMTKQQVIMLLGNRFTQNANMNFETLCWKCKTSTAIERELLSKKESFQIITAEFDNGTLVSYKLQ